MSGITNSWGTVKIALWGDSRENADNACSDIADILLNEVTDWDFQVHTGDITPGGNESDWQKALGYNGMDSIFVAGKFFMCTSNHDDYKPTYNKYTQGVLPANSANGTTHFYHHQQDDVHIIACDAYFTNSATMQNWLNSTLATISPDDWIIGFWHNPCYADLTYKSSYLSNCGPWLESLYQNGGDFVFHGHAHVYVRTHPLMPDETVNYETGMIHLINGCGGASWKSAQPQTQHTAFTPTVGSFACITFLTFDEDTVFIQTVDARPGKNLEVIDELTWIRAQRYPLTFNTQGSGEVSVEPGFSTFIEGTAVTITATSDVGWVFDHWSGDLTGTENPATYTTVDTNMNITAVFNELPAGQCELRVTTSGPGTVSINPSDNIYAKGFVVTLTAEPDSDCVFITWKGDKTGFTNPDTVLMNDHKSISASFKKKQYYNLSVNIIGSGDVIVNPSGNIFEEGTVVTITANPSSGWDFYHWSGNLSGQETNQAITVDTKKHATAHFILKGGIPVDLVPTDDSYIRGGGLAGINFNAAKFLRVNEGGGEKEHHYTYLKFDLSGISGSILYAVLNLTIKEGGLPDGSPASVDVYSVTDDSWLEAGIKWNNAPPGVTHLDSEINISSENGVYGWDVSSFVASEFSGDKVVSLMLRDNAVKNIQADFYGRVEDYPPILTIVNDTTGASSVNTEIELPIDYSLHQNYPNPFNPVTEIRYQLPQSNHIKLTVHDVRGRLVSTLIDKYEAAGKYTTTWNGTDTDHYRVPSGIYMCRYQADKYIKTIKMILIR
jgi:hypothetical protein